MAKQQCRRRTRVVQREVQTRMIMETTLLPLVGVIAMALTVALLCDRVVAEAAACDVQLPNLSLLLISVVCMTCSMACSTLYVAFRFSHRVAGPSYRLIESMKQIATGDLSFRVRLRNGDFLKEVADQMNVMLDALEQQQGSCATKPSIAESTESTEATEAVEQTVEAEVPSQV